MKKKKQLFDKPKKPMESMAPNNNNNFQKQTKQNKDKIN